MSFVEEFGRLPLDGWVARSLAASGPQVEAALAKDAPGMDEFAALISPEAAGSIERLSRRSRALTLRRFGRVIRLFAPLYLSNECVNNCQYCGFSRDNPILRVTLSVDEVRREARALVDQGFRNILLVAGEHPRFVSGGYMAECIAALRETTPSISLEVGPMETEAYRPLAAAGAEGLVVYQETYDPAIYAEMHTAGPKKDFFWRLETPERAYEAGFRRLGLGALLGLRDWRREAMALAAHAAYLFRHCWKAQITVSFPRLRPCAGEFQPPVPMSDRDLAQLICAFRIVFPDAGLVLSTREPKALRNGLIPIGITMISAGSHTEPGGYTGAGRENVHQTARGRAIPATGLSSEWAASAGHPTPATGQFEIADERSAGEVAEFLRGIGYDPVWKDWDTALAGA
jgi:2-iminoacetate synthase